MKRKQPKPVRRLALYRDGKLLTVLHEECSVLAAMWLAQDGKDVLRVEIRPLPPRRRKRRKV